MLQECTKDTQIEAANGQRFSLFNVVSVTLKFFKDHALRELTNQCGTTIDNDDIRWIITVPAIWNEPAKKFMRLAAYEVGIQRSTHNQSVASNNNNISGDSRETSFIYQRLSVIIQRFNAALYRETFVLHDDSDL